MIKFRRPRLILFDSAGMTQELRRSLNMVIVAVMFGIVYVNITSGAAWTGYLRALGADAFALGIIAAIPVAASTCQIFVSYLMEQTGKRRELFLYIGVFSRLLWIPMALIPYFVPMSVEQLRIVMVMVLLTLAAVSGAFVNVGFFSLVGDLVPIRIRGRYFGTRSAISLAVGVVTGLFVSFLMDHTSGYTGYAIVLVLAGTAGALDILCFLRVDWPKARVGRDDGKGLLAMLAEVWSNRPFRRLVLYITFWCFACNISAPFFNVYMLENIGMSYTEITLLNQVLPNIATVLLIGWWGRKLDEYGSMPVMRLTGIYCMLNSVFWVFTGYRSFLVLPIINTLSGFLFPAFDLAAQNLYLGQAPERNRSMYVAVYFACTQLFGNALSNAVGGYLVQNVLPLLEPLQWTILGFPQTRYHYIYLISGVLRVFAIFCLIPRITEEGSKSVGELVTDIVGGVRNRVSFAVRRARVLFLRRRARRLK